MRSENSWNGCSDVSDFLALDQIGEAAAYVRQRLAGSPGVGLILGSGLNDVAEVVQDAVAIPYAEIPHFPTAGIEGHVGCLVGGHLEGQAVVVMQGRVHYYEGFSMTRVGLPVRVMQSLGAEVLIVTNAAGGLDASFHAGEVMIIRDHINLVGMTGLNPLRGPNLDTFGPRFPDMSCAYDPTLRAAARAVAEQAGIPTHEGVYICLSGPSFETPADIRFLRLIGADAVGMSTVPEVTVARHGGMRVLGLSGISNVAAPEGDQGAETTHEEVLEAGRLLAPRMETIIRGVLRGL